MGTMKCDGCGAKIPEAGLVCPFCLRDKSAAKARKSEEGLWGVVILIFGAIGYWIGGGTGILWGLGLGLVFSVWASLKTQKKPVYPPSAPEVSVILPPKDLHVMPEVTEASRLAQPSDARARLAELKELQTEGLISEAEFVQKKQEILKLL